MFAANIVADIPKNVKSLKAVSMLAMMHRTRNSRLFSLALRETETVRAAKGPARYHFRLSHARAQEHTALTPTLRRLPQPNLD